jgi:hypothetical protein
MQRSSRTASRCGWAGLAVLATAATVGATAAWAQQTELTPAQIIAHRFPRDWSPAPVLPLLVEQGRSFEKHIASDPIFNSYSAWTQARVRPTNGDAFFNNAQIASIKDRLKLTPAQARYWPAVESALRAVAVRKTREGRVALDPNAMQRLETAARELVKNLSEAQKREVQTLVNLVGLKN